MTADSYPAGSAISSALSAVRRDVERRNNHHDLAYFTEHEERFARSAQRLATLLPPGTPVLDIGSHYLHFSALLQQLGYVTTGVDTPEFAELPFVVERARTFGVRNEELSPGGLASGEIIDVPNGSFRAVLFCEILEHITFNPIRFWRRVYDLLEVGGFIYITTPNGLQLLAVLGAVMNAVTLRRRGIRVEHIFSNVTYGHHWKEYGAREIREYFARLSPDFDVTVRAYSLSRGSAPRSDGLLKNALRRIGNATGFLAENLEAVVRLRGRTTWLAEPPAFG